MKLTKSVSSFHEIIYAKHSAADGRLHPYIIALQPSQELSVCTTTAEKKAGSILDVVNSERKIYCICFKTKDF